jgi:hypothetical protein
MGEQWKASASGRVIHIPLRDDPTERPPELAEFYLRAAAARSMGTMRPGEGKDAVWQAMEADVEARRRAAAEQWLRAQGRLADGTPMPIPPHLRAPYRIENSVA